MSTTRRRRARVWLTVNSVLAVIVFANWVAVSVHIENLRADAADTSGDAVPELLASADEFRGAQMIFGFLAIVLSVASIAIAAQGLRRGARRDSSRRAARRAGTRGI